ncbi:MAG: hypothetical protein AAGK78_04895, partial [Planctomycetota bacterium]
MFNRAPLQRMRWFAIAIVVSITLELAWSVLTEMHFAQVTGWTWQDLLASIPHVVAVILLVCGCVGVLLFPTKESGSKLAACCWAAIGIGQIASLLIAIVAEGLTWLSFSSISVLTPWTGLALGLAVYAWRPALAQWPGVILVAALSTGTYVLLQWTGGAFEVLAGETTFDDVITGRLKIFRRSITAFNGLATSMVAYYALAALALLMFSRRLRDAVNQASTAGL